MRTLNVLFGIVVSVVVIYSAVLYISKQGKYTHVVVEPTNSKGVEMSYRVEGMYSKYRYVQIDILENGKSRVTYMPYTDKANTKQGQSTERVAEFVIPQEAMKLFTEYYAKQNFFKYKVLDLNRDKITVTDVGTTIITYAKDGKKATLKYGFTKDKGLEPLVQAYGYVLTTYVKPQ